MTGATLLVLLALALILATTPPPSMPPRARLRRRANVALLSNPTRIGRGKTTSYATEDGIHVRVEPTEDGMYLAQASIEGRPGGLWYTFDVSPTEAARAIERAARAER